MKLFEIENRFTGKIIFKLKTTSLKLCIEAAVKQNTNLQYANLQSADLRYANLRYADLQYANLQYADLQSADLRYANLRSADLRSANLRYADLQYANLRYAKNMSKFRTTPLYILQDQVGKIRAYKLVNKNNEGPYNGGIIYKKGKTYTVKKVNKNENESCGAGINLATLDWCLSKYIEGYKILIAEFTKKDIVAIPIGSDGKFRVSKCKIIGEKNKKDLGVK